MMTVLRKAEHHALSEETLSGSVLDLGGHKNSEYVQYLKGNFTRTTANLSEDADIQCNFEKPLPIADATYDGALLINVLEHIFEYRHLLNETARILKPGGKIILVVPFLFPYHPSPSDYHRYTAPALEKALETAGFTSIHVTPLGTGVCQAQWLLVERLLPPLLQFLSFFVGPLSALIDWLLSQFARLFGKKYQTSDYALGFKVVGAKS